MKAESSFVWTNCTIHLNPEAAVDLKVTFVINPWNTKHNNTFRFRDSFEYFRRFVLRVIFHEWNYGFSNLMNCLMIFTFTWIFCFHLLHEGINFFLKFAHRYFKIKMKEGENIKKTFVQP